MKRFLRKNYEKVPVALLAKNSNIAVAVDLIVSYSQIDGAHHKAWVLDQVLRCLVSDKEYNEIINMVDPEYGEPYGWDEGIAP